MQRNGESNAFTILKNGQTKTFDNSYPNVPFTVLQRKGTDGAGVHVANPKSHNYKSHKFQLRHLLLYSITSKHKSKKEKKKI